MDQLGSGARLMGRLGPGSQSTTITNHLKINLVH